MELNFRHVISLWSPQHGFQEAPGTLCYQACYQAVTSMLPTVTTLLQHSINKLIWRTVIVSIWPSEDPLGAATKLAASTSKSWPGVVPTLSFQGFYQCLATNLVGLGGQLVNILEMFPTLSFQTFWDNTIPTCSGRISNKQVPIKNGLTTTQFKIW